MHLLYVCTGNICRSPIAERLTLLAATRALGAGASGIRVSSAGTDAAPGRPMHPFSARALGDRGGDPSGFVSRPLTRDWDADLVLTMTRRQRTVVMSATPRAMRRTFTLREAAGLLEIADLTGLGDVSLNQRASELAARLDAVRRHRFSGPADDVTDPIGQPPEAHTAAAADVAGALAPLTAVLFAPVRAAVTGDRA